MNELMTTIAGYDSAWRSFLEGRGYRGLEFTVRIEPVNDQVKYNIWFSNSEYSATHFYACDHNIIGTLSHVESDLMIIDSWIKQQPLESDAREQTLLRDYAAIKERIAASSLSDIIKEEAASLMKRMTKNILTNKK